MKAFDIVRNILIIILLAALIALVVAAQTLIIKSGNAADQVSSLAYQTNRRVQDTSSNVNALLIQVGLTADNIRRASESQEKATQKTLAILEHTDQLLSSAESSVRHLSDSSMVLEASANTSLESLTQTLDETRVTIAEAHKQLTSPRAEHISSNLEQASDNLVIVSAESAGSMRNVNDTTLIVKQAFQKWTSPKGFVSNLWSGFLQVVGLGANTAKIVKP